jgi:alpha-galactosidase
LASGWASRPTNLAFETFTSPKAFVALFEGNSWAEAFEQDLATYLRKYLTTKKHSPRKLPTAVYTTQLPFGTDISEAYIKKLTDDLAPTGIDHVLLGDGWQDRYGDWNVDTRKFPNGLRPLADYMRAKGIVPGIWIALATASDTSNVAQDHPDWFMTDREGNPANLHANFPKRAHTMSLDTPWFDYILQKIRSLVDDNALGYVRLDMAAVYSAYRLNNVEAGDWATGAGRTYANQRESLWRLYERTGALLDSLRASHPALLVDCTADLYGRTNGLDLWLLQHTDYTYLTTLRTPAPTGNRAARQLLYDRSHLAPGGTILVGGLRLDDPLFRKNVLSQAASVILLTGDVTRLLPADKVWLKTYLAWLTALNERTQYTRFYQSTDLFSRPDAHHWDGCLRLNPERNGGLLCLYRNDTPEATRTVALRGLRPTSNYQVRQGGTNTVVGTYTGQQLLTAGLAVTIPNRHEGALFSIEAITKPDPAKAGLPAEGPRVRGE